MSSRSCNLTPYGHGGIETASAEFEELAEIKSLQVRSHGIQT